MNHQDDLEDDLVEALLRKQFEGGITDDGFTARVMQRLPPRRHRIAWPLWLGLLAGAGACWLSVAGLPWVRVNWRNWTGSLSTSTIVLLLAMAGLSLLACWWSIAEADDR